jgi:hypothetical protein
LFCLGLLHGANITMGSIIHRNQETANRPEEYAQMALVSSYANLGWAVLAPLLAGVLVIVLRTRADHCPDEVPPIS